MNVSPVRQGAFPPCSSWWPTPVTVLGILAGAQAVFVDTTQLLSALVNGSPRHLGLLALCQDLPIFQISGNLTGTVSVPSEVIMGGWLLLQSSHLLLRSLSRPWGKRTLGLHPTCFFPDEPGRGLAFMLPQQHFCGGLIGLKKGTSHTSSLCKPSKEVNAFTVLT